MAAGIWSIWSNVLKFTTNPLTPLADEFLKSLNEEVNYFFSGISRSYLTRLLRFGQMF